MSEPELRYQRMNGAWVFVAASRAAVMEGPDPLAGLPELAGPCPFCPGSPSGAERTLLARPETGPWQARVLANKHPVTRPLAPEAFVALPEGGISVAHGAHELVIESPDHDGDVATYSPAHLALVLGLLRDRHAAVAALPGVASVSTFRNKGRKAGASQPHPHSQVVGSACPLPEPSGRFQRALAHRAASGTTLLDTVLHEEHADRALDVLETDAYRVVIPRAPMRTFETWIVPKTLRGCFSRTPDALLPDLAEALGRAVRKVLRASGRVDYNLIFRTPPPAAREHPAAFHYVELLPRGPILAGLELTSGTGVVAVRPEDAAARIRAASDDPSRA